MYIYSMLWKVPLPFQQTFICMYNSHVDSTYVYNEKDGYLSNKFVTSTHCIGFREQVFVSFFSKEIAFFLISIVDSIVQMYVDISFIRQHIKSSICSQVYIFHKYVYGYN